MKLFGALAFFVLLFVFSHARASATICSQPNALTNGGYVDANGLNANFQALVTCGNSVDNSQIGTLGIYASQIIPLSVGEATFGGTVAYVFPAGLQISGGNTLSINGVFESTTGVPLQLCSNLTMCAILNTSGSAVFPYIVSGTSSATTTKAYYAPLYTFAGAAAGTNTHANIASTSCTTNGSGACSVNVSTTAFSYTAPNTYACNVDFVNATVVSGTAEVTNLTSATVTINVVGATPSTSVGLSIGCQGY